MNTTRVNYRLFFDLCILCQQPSKHCSSICDSCLQDLPWLQTHCQICSIPLNTHTETLICKQCIDKPPSFSKTYALLEYRFPINALMNLIKYQRKPEYLGHLSALFSEKMPQLEHIDCIMPIPMHRWDLFKRGFNQAALIAQLISKFSQLPLEPTCLQKTIRSPKQASLTRQARLKNLNKAFSCTSTPPARVLLVDDVMTTTATVEAAANTLLKAGAEHIEVLVIARTP